MSNISLEQLYELIWSKPLATVAKHCQISIPELRQICLSYEIPVPWSSFKEVNKHEGPPSIANFEFDTALAAARISLHFAGEDDFELPAKVMAPDPFIISAQRTITQDFNLYNMPHMLRGAF